METILTAIEQSAYNNGIKVTVVAPGFHHKKDIINIWRNKNLIT